MDMARMHQNWHEATKNGHDAQADYWKQRIEEESDRLEREARHDEWSVLVDNRHG